MLKRKTHHDLREEVIQALRRNGHRQIRGTYRAGNGLCALELIREVLKNACTGRFNDFEIMQVLECPEWLASMIVKWNDCKCMSFSEIADRLETLFRQPTADDIRDYMIRNFPIEMTEHAERIENIEKVLALKRYLLHDSLASFIGVKPKIHEFA